MRRWEKEREREGKRDRAMGRKGGRERGTRRENERFLEDGNGYNARLGVIIVQVL